MDEAKDSPLAVVQLDAEENPDTARPGRNFWRHTNFTLAKAKSALTVELYRREQIYSSYGQLLDALQGKSHRME